MKKAPNLWDVDHLLELGGGFDKSGKGLPKTLALINGKWVPARPIGFFSFKYRAKLAWMVFTGKADALKWPEGQ